MITEDEFLEKLGRFMEAGKFQKALDLADKYQREGGVPRTLEWGLIGSANKALHRTDAALQNFNNAIAAAEDSNDVPSEIMSAAYYWKADLLDDIWRETGKQELIKEAKDAYKKCIEYNPSIFPSYYNLACIECLTGNKKKAIEYLTLAMNADPEAVLDEMASDSDFKDLRNDKAFTYLLAQDPCKLKEETQEKIFVFAANRVLTNWEDEPYQLTCPVCHESHQYTLRVKKTTIAAKASENFYKSRDYSTTRIFICPITGKPFSTEITLTIAPMTLIKAVQTSVQGSK